MLEFNIQYSSTSEPETVPLTEGHDNNTDHKSLHRSTEVKLLSTFRHIIIPPLYQHRLAGYRNGYTCGSDNPQYIWEICHGIFI